MGILSNFIGGFAGAGGEILQRERESGVRVKESQDIAKFNDDLATRREMALEALREERKIAGEQRAVQTKRDNDAYEASPERIAQLTAADRAKNEGLIGNRIALAPKAAEAAATEFEAGKGTREAAQKEKLTFDLESFRQKTEAELRADIKRMNDPEYRKGVSLEAAAKRDPVSSALAGVQLKAAQLALKEKEAEGKIPPAVGKLADAARKEMDVVTSAITKAMAENMFDPNSDNAKSLMAQHAAAAKRFNDLLTPYAGDRASKSTDSGSTGGESQAHADAARAIATGKISAAEANKRLQSAGFAPLNGSTPEKRKGILDTANKSPVAPVDSLGDQPIGKFTPMSMINESAKAGNKKAIAYLQARAQGEADNAAAPRTAAEILNQR